MPRCCVGEKSINLYETSQAKARQNKAIVRDHIYLWVARGSTRNGSGKEVWSYCVRTRGYNDRKWNKELAKRDAALTYANRLSKTEGIYPVESQNKYVIS